MLRIGYLAPLLGATLITLAACGDDDATETGGEGQACHEDGTCDGSLSCVSGICEPPPLCSAGDTQPCTCTGGDTGAQTCLGDGVWDDCLCAAGCGNGAIEAGEECDGDNLAGRTCETEGFANGGILECDSSCQLVTSGCDPCGNGVIDGEEECDGENLAGHTCESDGFASGVLDCDPSTCTIDDSGCYACGPDGTPCTPEALCQVDGTCEDDVCVGVLNDCSEVTLPNDCFEAACNPATGVCEVAEVAPETPCSIAGEYCVVDRTCLAGACQGGQPRPCPLNPPTCMVCVCNEAQSSFTLEPDADSTPCLSGDLCVANAYCQSGWCVGTPKDCFFSPLSECNDVACNPATGDCEGTPDPGADGAPCSQSGDLCMVNKSCQSGQCIGGTARDCSYLTAGCDNGVCDPSSGLCAAQPIAPGGSCPDAADECNSGVCDASGLCQPSPLPDLTPCNDLDPCTTGDECSGGVCGGTVDPSCTVYLEATFDTCPQPGWTLSGDWECGIPTEADEPTTTVSGTGCLGTVIGAHYNPGNAWATSVADTHLVSLATSTTPTLSFWLWIDSEGSTYDGANLKLSTDGGANFTVLDTSLPYTLTIYGEQAWGGRLASAGWQQVTADLTPFNGQTVILRFAFRSDSLFQYPGIYIDDVEVSD